MAKKDTSPYSSPETVQRTYRFNGALFHAFEEDCATQLANPKRVMEALILHWIESKTEARANLARNRNEKIGTISQED